jgi:hypothetical protein
MCARFELTPRLAGLNFKPVNRQALPSRLNAWVEIVSLAVVSA